MVLDINLNLELNLDPDLFLELLLVLGDLSQELSWTWT
jgi:hypothetical protein